ncbi:MAG: hypothetical protein V7727_20760 [Sneathiella sp.]
MKKIYMGLAIAGALTIASGTAKIADAHTISIGFVPGVSLGEVTFWVGNYTHGSPGNVPQEGSMQLSGENANPYVTTVNPFDIPAVLALPTGLVAGTNYFFAGNGGLSNTCVFACPVTAWQGVTIGGLAAGDYSFKFLQAGSPTVDWAQINDTLSSTFTLKSGDIGGGPSVVPLPAALPLYGAGLAVMGFIGWRKRRKSDKA